jgi:hypothetical protein
MHRRAHRRGGTTVTEFATATDRLLNQVRHWAEPRWSGDRAERVFALVQLLADLAADAEARPRRTVPRDRATLLPDQLRVMADDLLAAEPGTAVLTEATAAVQAVRSAL